MMTVDKVIEAEYEEDGYLEYARRSDTPSFDPEEPAAETLFPSLLSPSSMWSATNFVIAEDDDDSYTIETEFVQQNANATSRVKDVRVKFQDLSKPYLARITNNQNYLKFLHLVKGTCVVAVFRIDDGLSADSVAELGCVFT